jgi:hypothetical protein
MKRDIKIRTELVLIRIGSSEGFCKMNNWPVVGFSSNTALIALSTNVKITDCQTVNIFTGVGQNSMRL